MFQKLLFLCGDTAVEISSLSAAVHSLTAKCDLKTQLILLFWHAENWLRTKSSIQIFIWIQTHWVIL